MYTYQKKEVFYNFLNIKLIYFIKLPLDLKYYKLIITILINNSYNFVFHIIQNVKN